MTIHLCDVNVWLALALSKHEHHADARAWLDAVDEPASVGFCRTTQQSFLRLLTDSAVLARYGNPSLSNAEAWAAYDAFLADDRIVLWPDEPVELEEWWRSYMTPGLSSPKLWTDAFLAAFARAGGHRLVTIDRAFRQFPGLDLVVLGGDKLSG